MFAILGGLILKTLYTLLQKEWIAFKIRVIHYFNSIINNSTVQAMFFIFVGIVISFLSYKIYRKIKISREKTKRAIERIEKEEKYIRKFLSMELGRFDYEKVKEKLKELHEKYPSRTPPELKDKLKKIDMYLRECKHEKKVRGLREEKSYLQREIRQLEWERLELKRARDERKRDIKNNLDVDENPVFEKFNLNDKEIQVLLEEGYKQANEYCVTRQRLTTVLVKPPHNHSVTHTFLVWSVKQLLEEYPEIEHLREHETRDADLTFKLRGRYYAIEIETGSLLRKKDHFNNKMKLLDRKYKNRWAVIVSKRELAPKYNKFGLCIPRNRVREKLPEWLKI